MQYTGYVPGDMRTAKLHRSILLHDTGSRLRRFQRDQHRCQRFAFRFGKVFPYLSFHSGGVDIPGHYNEQIIGSVHLFVVRHQIFARKRLKHILVADHRMPIWRDMISGLEQTAAGTAVGIILSHIHFAQNHLFLLFQLLRRQSRVLHDIAEDIHCRFHSAGRNVYIVKRVIERGAGIHLAAGLLHFLIYPPTFPVSRSLKEHVFQHMTHPGSRPVSLGDAARPRPGMSGRHRRAVIFLQDQRQSVFKIDPFDPCRQTGSCVLCIHIVS